MPRRALRLIMLCLCLTTIAAPDALAQQGRGQQGGPEQAGQERRKGSSMSPREAAAKAQAQHGGRVLKVTPKGPGYRVRLLKDDGRVVTVTIGE